MVETAKRPATYADLEAVPPHLTAEIIDGVLYTHPKPVPRHGNGQFSLAAELGGPFQKGRGGPGGWWFVNEPELRLGPHVVSPDLVGWRRERMPTFPETAYIDLPPDWVCEFLSPRTEKRDRGAKRRIYATYNVSHYWLIHPVERYLEVYALNGGKWMHVETYEDGDAFRAPPFDAIELRLEDILPISSQT